MRVGCLPHRLPFRPVQGRLARSLWRGSQCWCCDSGARRLHDLQQHAACMRPSYRERGALATTYLLLSAAVGLLAAGLGAGLLARTAEEDSPWLIL
jgi:hypothetical protein